MNKMAAWSKKGRPRTEKCMSLVDDADFAAVLRDKTLADAAAYFGVSEITITRESRRRKMSRKPRVISEDGQKILADFTRIHDSFSDEILAERFGLSVSGIQKMRARLGLRKDQKKLWVHSPHPRGATGMSHSNETRKIISTKSREAWSKMTGDALAKRTELQIITKTKNGTMAPHRYGATWKCGWRDIGGQRKFFRSKWEANYGRYLEWLREKGEIVSWEHEPETFWFDGVKRGCVSYLPDFRVVMKNSSIEYHEVKGWMDGRSRTKIARMARYHPDVKLVVVDSRAYRALVETAAKLVPGWE